MIAYLDCFSGVSGDMLLGALLDAGLALDTLRAGLARLPLGDFRVEVERVSDHGISGTRAVVVVDAGAPQPERRLSDIEALLDAAGLAPGAERQARAIFRRLAAAEATVHGSSVEEVHFHEVGAVDSIVDVVGVAIGLDALGVETLYCSELPLTTGRVRTAHGELPVPAPATVELLRGTGAVWRPVEAMGELVTPTGAAVVATLGRFERPTLRTQAVGYGFGSRRLPWANCVRVLLGEAPTVRGAAALALEMVGLEQDRVVTIESNIDTMTGEALGWLMERLFVAGALDVSYTPLQMKKQRPGSLLLVIAAPDDAERLAALIVRESGTLGVRLGERRRVIAGRREARIETALGEARVKLKLVGGRVVSASPEYEDCRVLAERHHLPVEEVMEQVRGAARAQFALDARGDEGEAGEAGEAGAR